MTLQWTCCFPLPSQCSASPTTSAADATIYGCVGMSLSTQKQQGSQEFGLEVLQKRSSEYTAQESLPSWQGNQGNQTAAQNIPSQSAIIFQHAACSRHQKGLETSLRECQTKRQDCQRSDDCQLTCTLHAYANAILPAGSCW